MRVGARVLDVSWVKRERFMLLILLLVFEGVDFSIFCSNFCGCGRILKE